MRPQFFTRIGEKSLRQCQAGELFPSRQNLLSKNRTVIFLRISLTVFNIFRQSDKRSIVFWERGCSTLHAHHLRNTSSLQRHIPAQYNCDNRTATARMSGREKLRRLPLLAQASRTR